VCYVYTRHLRLRGDIRSITHIKATDPHILYHCAWLSHRQYVPQIPPFLGGKLVATPPGSALHFKQDQETITIDFLYFVPSTLSTSPTLSQHSLNTTSTSGAMSSTRLLTLTTAQWQARIASGLAANKAQACYDAGQLHLANQRAAAANYAGTMSSSMGASEIVAWVGFSVFGLFCMVGFGLAYKFYLQRTEAATLLAPTPTVCETPMLEELSQATERICC